MREFRSVSSFFTAPRGSIAGTSSGQREGQSQNSVRGGTEGRRGAGIFDFGRWRTGEPGGAGDPEAEMTSALAAREREGGRELDGGGNLARLESGRGRGGGFCGLVGEGGEAAANEGAGGGSSTASRLAEAQRG
ncbi:hypothetical protein Salat_1139800 [Sesamum alatum]|uniref:Uncharacterized protein n=1 Tax=Sesamum alatum TaxID=300844 RepID=A0AAE2CN81_9LAMI|nr:hypothetical protein Salat_1139800 [Sesamum alatum]